ncbi:MAG: FAD:protein FMN transferase, partial [Desulfuromonadales bacterium]|nr:FAD:protein FMN transferase [Desulfuromonadales bacterium]
SRRIANRTNGAFDVTLGRLIRLWGFAEGEPRLPAAGEITRALSGSGPESFKISGNMVEKESTDLAIDLGGVAKGYAIDRAVA